MREIAGACLVLFSAVVFTAYGAALPSCDAGVPKYSPCELRFEWSANELPAGRSAYRDELLNVEFRGPDQTTFLVRAFWSGGRILRARFTPNQSGNWFYRVTSDIKRFEVREAKFSVAENNSHGFVSVANVRHWWTDDKQPHLWSSVEVPWLTLDLNAFQQFVQTRKQEGFTHLRGVVLTGSGALHPLTKDGLPDSTYFEKLDDRLLYAHEQNLVLDLVLADQPFLRANGMENWDERAALIRHVVSRYAPLNVTWQGVEAFEDGAGTRDLLKDIGSLLQKFDSFRHPRSTDARMTSSMLLRDGWENFIVEASPNAQLGAVERQTTAAPQIHVIQSAQPDEFRHELWSATASGEYPTVSYQAIQNPANVQAMKVWFTIMPGVRHWEFEPFFDVDNARAAGLENVEYLLYAEHPGAVEIEFPEKHKYNPHWINPRTGEIIDLKDVKQDTYSETTPSTTGDWILQVPRDGQKEGMLKSYKFESMPAPVQDVELNPLRLPFDVAIPSAQDLDGTKPIKYQIKLKKTNRATRTMQYVWIGEVVASNEGPRIIGVGAEGALSIPAYLLTTNPAILNVRINAINANGKAYSLEKAFQVSK